MGYFPMQMNNAWGVCAFFTWGDSRGETHAKPGRDRRATYAKPGRDRRAARAEGAATRKDERHALKSLRPGGASPGRSNAAGAAPVTRRFAGR